MNRLSTSGFLFRGLLLLSLVGIPCFAGTVSADLTSPNPNTLYRVIVTYKTGVAKSMTAASVVNTGMTVVGTLPNNQELCDMLGSAIKNMANDASIEHISLDHKVVSTGTAKPVYDYMPQNIGLGAGVSFNLGQGVGVAVIDSGINVNDDLSSAFWYFNVPRVWYSESFVPGDSSTADKFGHGTHVAGIIAGDGSNSMGAKFTNTVHGVAPGVHLINLRVLDAKGASMDSTVISAIDRAIQLKNWYNIKVINLSLGRPVYESYKTDPLCQAVERAWAAGITVVVAAGNGGRDTLLKTKGYATIGAPGNDPRVITVGASNSESQPNWKLDKMTTYSSKGPTRRRSCCETRPCRSRQPDLLDLHARCDA